jgi:hypothetical protein
MPPLRGLCHLPDRSTNMARLRRSTASKIDAKHYIRGVCTSHSDVAMLWEGRPLSFVATHN